MMNDEDLPPAPAPVSENLSPIEDDAAQKDFEDRINKLLAHFVADTVDPEGEDEDGFAIFSLADKDGVIVVGTLKDLEDLAEQEQKDAADAKEQGDKAAAAIEAPQEKNGDTGTLEHLRDRLASIGATLLVDPVDGVLNLTAALVSEDQTRQFSSYIAVNYTALDLEQFYEVAVDELTPKAAA